MAKNLNSDSQWPKLDVVFQNFISTLEGKTFEQAVEAFHDFLADKYKPTLKDDKGEYVRIINSGFKGTNYQRDPKSGFARSIRYDEMDDRLEASIDAGRDKDATDGTMSDAEVERKYSLKIPKNSDSAYPYTLDDINNMLIAWYTVDEKKRTPLEAIKPARSNINKLILNRDSSNIIIETEQQKLERLARESSERKNANNNATNTTRKKSKGGTNMSKKEKSGRVEYFDTTDNISFDPVDLNTGNEKNKKQDKSKKKEKEQDDDNTGGGGTIKNFFTRFKKGIIVVAVIIALGLSALLTTGIVHDIQNNNAKQNATEIVQNDPDHPLSDDNLNRFDKDAEEHKTQEEKEAEEDDMANDMFKGEQGETQDPTPEKNDSKSRNQDKSQE